MSLEGKVVAITRPERQAEELARKVRKLGGKPYLVPTMEIKPQQNERVITGFCHRILTEPFHLIIFMSVNGVITLIHHSEKMGIKTGFIQKLNESTIIAIGPKTGGELEERGVEVDLIPKKYSSRGIVESLKETDLHQKTVALPRSNQPSGYLKKELEKMGAEVFERPVYMGTPPSDHSRFLDFIHRLSEGKIDVVTFTSSSIARNPFKIAGEHLLTDQLRKGLNSPLTVSIGPVTAETLEKLGVKVDVVPEKYTIEGMMEALLDQLEGTR